MLSPAFLGANAGNQSAFDLTKIFKTSLYTGNGSTQDIVTGINYVVNEGLLWIKDRDISNANVLTDTLRGVNSTIVSNSTNAVNTATDLVTAFNNDGFSVGSSGSVNTASNNLVAWQFLVEQGFFDIVETTGTGIAKTVPHNLNSDVGFIVTKRLDLGGIWLATHKDFAINEYVALSNITGVATGSTIYPSLPTTTDFELGTNSDVNASGGSYIHYLWAHNPSKGIFCGSYTGTGASGNKQTTGFPVGWVMIKRISSADDWVIIDNTRDNINPSTLGLKPNLADAESSNTGVNFLSDGFDFAGGSYNASSEEHIYIAIADPTQF